tara:strand:+ start:2200 stop:2424 length:225 start_codon:yes stop_codon:yes gene_type:complete
MNLLELNARFAVKLHQDLNTVLNMEWLDFSLMLNIINDDISKSNDSISNNGESNTTSVSNKSFAVNLPSHLKTK